MRSIEDIDLESKNVLLRTDLNLPVEDDEPKKTVRFERYMETIEALSKKDGRIMIVAHQGRPSRKDFLSLERHAEMVSEELGEDVKFVQSFFGPEVGDAVASMDDGDVIMMENVRFLSEELQNMPSERHATDYFVQNLSSYFDVFVDDAFSAAHRSHGSIVGFAETLESYPGLVMEREIKSNRRVRDELDSPVLVLGGEKPSDIVKMLEKMIGKAEKVLLAGIPGELGLMIEGHELGSKSDWISERNLDSSRDELRELLEEHGDKIMLPKDLAAEDGDYVPGEIPDSEMTWDIGQETIKEFRKIILDAESVLMKGPMGAFEQHPEGTEEIIEAVANSDAFSVLGGGHTSSLVERFGLEYEQFSHVSIAGGAFVRFMAGEELPGVEVLQQ